MSGPILVVRLGAMGDIIHALPAVASLKASWPERRVVWVMAQRWVPLVEGNPAVDQVISFDRRTVSSFARTWRELRQARIETAIDFQGLIQSALIGRAAAPRALIGFDRAELREPAAAMFYTRRVAVTGPHRVERNLQLAEAAGARSIVRDCWIPQGRDEGGLPASPFVLTTPFAGWTGKEWPVASLDALGAALRDAGWELVANVPEARASELHGCLNLRVHSSSLSGLICAIRRAAAVVAPDSGPLHLAAALGKPGVALFGPTDPVSHGPFGGTLTVVRAPGFDTTYKRHRETHPSMQAISVAEVRSALLESLARPHAQASV